MIAWHTFLATFLVFPSGLAGQAVCSPLWGQGHVPAPLSGKIIDSVSRQPVCDVSISIDGALQWDTDSLGRYSLFPAPGTHTISFQKRGYFSSTRLVTTTSTSPQRLDVALLAAPDACCWPTGRWELSLYLDSAAPDMPPPLASEVRGAVVFQDTLPRPWGLRRWQSPTFKLVLARTDIDLFPLLGAKYKMPPPWAASADSSAEWIRKATGMVFVRDSIEIEIAYPDSGGLGGSDSIVPPFNHGHLILEGRLIRRDSVAGSWRVARVGYTPVGHFVMARR